MKRIVLCFDGTWNSPADESIPEGIQVETNVRRFFESIPETGRDGVPQKPWYNEGVGTSILNSLPGAAFGAGLDKHIIDGYRHLVETYSNGDEVFVLGFSRGAYAARSLVGMIRKCGLVRPMFESLQIGIAFGIYRFRDNDPDTDRARHFRQSFSREIPIKFVGVWDTVGALGIPLDAAKRLNDVVYQFHDTQLSSIVERAYQAMALDEHRGDYAVTLWTPKARPAQILEQRWFSGAHKDVGGGYENRRLSDLALRWMQDRAIEAGLTVDPVAITDDNFKGVATDSYKKFLGGVYASTHARFFRPVLKTAFGNERLDPSVDRRRRDATLAYHPENDGLPSLTA